MFGQKKTNQIIIHSVRPLHGCRGLQISKYSPCSEPIETLLFVCGSLCCLCFPVPSLFLLIFLHFSLCSDLVDKFIILLPAQNSDHPTMPATKEGIHLELKYFQSQHTDLSDRTSYQISSSTRPSNISFNPSGLAGSGWLCWSETIYYCCSGCGCLFVTPEYYVWLPRS